MTNSKLINELTEVNVSLSSKLTYQQVHVPKPVLQGDIQQVDILQVGSNLEIGVWLSNCLCK